MERKKLDKAYESIYNCIYNEPGEIYIKWNPLKSSRLKFTRGVSFEEIIHAKLVDIIDHPIRKNQLIYICEHRGYLWLVPFVFDGKAVFLKTIYPSRKAMKIYRKVRS